MSADDIGFKQVSIRAAIAVFLAVWVALVWCTAAWAADATGNRGDTPSEHTQRKQSAQKQAQHRRSARKHSRRKHAARAQARRRHAAHRRHRRQLRNRRNDAITEIAHELGYSLTPSKTEPYAACPPQPGAISCASIVVPPGAVSGPPHEDGASPYLEGSGEKGGLSPLDLRSAYNLSASGGEGRTVAIVSAFDYPAANADLKIFREKYGLPSCTEENGCFRKLNQKGEEKNYPASNASWNLESALDLDMASAMCPNCHLVLVEADDNFGGGLDISNDIAAETPGVTVISNSWGGDENSFSPERDFHFDHPGIPVFFASGDSGYGNCQTAGHTCYPAASPKVTAVGGTTLEKAENTRGWQEASWSGAGSGCTTYATKPSWQTDKGCSKRMVADVSAVANFIASPVSVYYGAWKLVGGTSASAPIVAGVMAQASKAVREQGPEAFYRHSLFDVTAGGACGDLYLCNTREGYDAHTGWGSPNGPLSLTVGFSAFTDAATNVTKTAATLNGYVDPEGLSTSYHFEYGPTTAYGTSVPASNESVGSGFTWKAVSQSIAGLAQAKTYHYRLVATNGSGTVYGKDRTFGTIPWTITPMPKPAETAKESYKGSTRESRAPPQMPA